jgi:4-azaleucine resistance transporter AzlC
MQEIESGSRFVEFWNGVKATFPLVVGAIPFGIIFSALAITAGLSREATMAMSALVFAGSSQFIAVGLIASGASAGTIVITTFIVNLRHALYATTLGHHVKNLPQKWLVPLGFFLTDETFVVTAQRYNKNDSSSYKHWFYLGSALFMYLNWQLCTTIGLIAGEAIPDPASWGLDFAMIVTFIGMLVPMVADKPVLISVLVAGVSAVAANGLPNQMGLFLAAILGIGAGLIVERMGSS